MSPHNRRVYERYKIHLSAEFSTATSRFTATTAT